MIDDVKLLWITLQVEVVPRGASYDDGDLFTESLFHVMHWDFVVCMQFALHLTDGR